MKKTNHICKNKNCPNGVNGEPKHYYACNYCDRTNQWRSVACCPECYDEYIKQVVDARSKNKSVDTLPDRTDMTKQEVQELMERPVDEVAAEVKNDLKEYIDEGLSVAEAIDEINNEIEKNESVSQNNVNYSKSKKKKKQVNNETAEI